MNFRHFFESVDNDAKEIIKKIPAAHRKLTKQFSIHFEKSATLKGDHENIGRVDDETKKITIAAPLHHSRSFVLLHEIAHLIWSQFVKGTKLETEWNKIAKATRKGKPTQSIEELFAHGYAAHFVKYPPEIFRHPSWTRFFDKLIKQTR